jgi:predicted ester cyclase
VSHLKSLIEQFYAVLDTQDWLKIDTWLAPGFTTYSGVTPVDFQKWREGNRAFYTAFAGAQHTIDDYIAEGDRVVTRARLEGVHSGPFLGAAPTGRRISMSIFHIDTFLGDRLVEHRGQTDMLGLMRQIGALPPA